MTTSDDPKIRMQSLRLLINLSTNENMVKHLLTSKVSIQNILPGLDKLCNYTVTNSLINTNLVLFGVLGMQSFMGFDRIGRRTGRG